MRWRNNSVTQQAMSASGWIVEEDPEIVIACIDPEDNEMGLMVNGQIKVRGIVPAHDGQDVRDAMIRALAQRYVTA